MRRLAEDEGAALLVALMAMMLLIALGTALTLTTITETRIASSYGVGIETFYAADAAIERAIGDLRALPDWRGVAAGGAMSSFVDGQPGGARSLVDGTTLNLADATTGIGGGDSPPWRLFAYGPVADLLPAGGIRSRAYIVVWVAEAALEPHGDALALLAHAYGPRGVQRAVRAVVRHGDLSGSRAIRVISWREGP